VFSLFDVVEDELSFKGKLKKVSWVWMDGLSDDDDVRMSLGLRDKHLPSDRRQDPHTLESRGSSRM
jgi:hypothetical protein